MLIVIIRELLITYKITYIIYVKVKKCGIHVLYADEEAYELGYIYIMFIYIIIRVYLIMWILGSKYTSISIL